MYSKEVLKAYEENRPVMVEETRKKLEETKLKLKSDETNSFFCRDCGKEIFIRERKNHSCMDCYIPKITKGNCSKCGRLLIKENDTGKCFFEEGCNLENLKSS